MPNPRNVISNIGIASQYATFIIDNSTIVYSAAQANGSAVVGRAVSLSADNTIKLAADADAVIGKLINVEPDNKATVQIGGIMQLGGGTAAALTRGKKIVGALNTGNPGFIREVNTAVAAEGGVAAGKILANGTTTAVEVYLN